MSQETKNPAQDLLKTIPLVLFFLPKNLFFRRAFGIAPMDAYQLYEAINLDSVRHIPLFSKDQSNELSKKLENRLLFPYWDRIPGYNKAWFIYDTAVRVQIVISYINDEFEFKCYRENTLQDFLDSIETKNPDVTYRIKELPEGTGNAVITILKDLGIWD